MSLHFLEVIAILAANDILNRPTIERDLKHGQTSFFLRV